MILKIIEAINRIDSLKPNGYSQLEKILWLSQLDAKVKSEIIDCHEGWEDVEFSGYDENTDTETELLIKSPHDDIYLYWLEAKIDYTNGEFSKYNNSISMYNAVISDYTKYYNRTHMPLKAGYRFY